MSADISTDAQAFYRFLGAHLHGGEAEQSPEQLLREWRDRQEYESTVEAVREGVADMEAGRMKSARELLQESRTSGPTS